MTRKIQNKFYQHPKTNNQNHKMFFRIFILVNSHSNKNSNPKKSHPPQNHPAFLIPLNNGSNKYKRNNYGRHTLQIKEGNIDKSKSISL